MAPDWLKQACNLYYKQGDEQAIVLIQETLQSYISNENFHDLNKDIFFIVIDRVPLSLLLCILQETKDCKDSLPYRRKFFDSVEKRALDRSEWSISLFSGLR